MEQYNCKIIKRVEQLPILFNQQGINKFVAIFAAENEKKTKTKGNEKIANTVLQIKDVT